MPPKKEAQRTGKFLKKGTLKMIGELEEKNTVEIVKRDGQLLLLIKFI